MSTTAVTINAACANCGKAEEGDNKLKTCTSCKIAKYCCRDCQISHWPKHKTACKERAAELLDEELFKDPEEREECPICMLPLPFKPSQIMFQLCCGKTICCGCIHAQSKEDFKNGKAIDDIGVCPFCRELSPATKEIGITQLKNGMKKNYAGAFHVMGGFYMKGEKGFPRDLAKAREMFLKAGELGCSDAYGALADSYKVINAEEEDVLEKRRHYFELAAIRDCIPARHSLGCLDLEAGDYQRAYKHFVICAKAGLEISLTAIRKGYAEGYIAKDEYSEILRAYQEKNEDMKSEMRDEYMVYKANTA